MKGVPKILQLVADNKAKGGEYRIENKDNAATIYVYDVIGGAYGGVDETQFAKDVAALNGVTDIALRVNSPGGDVFAARAMMTALANHPATVTAYVDGIAASAATSLIQAADKIVMTRGAQMMIHEAWTFALGNKSDLRTQATLLESIDNEIAKDYANRTGKSVADLAAMMAAETWFTADEAKDAGFVDEVVEATKAASNKWNLGAYKNVPRDLVEPPAAPQASVDEQVKEHRANLLRRLALVEKTSI